MRTIIEQELKDILDKHGKYLRSEPGGERADLSNANLGGASLYGANLYGADLSRANLSNADLGGADLRSANLSGASLCGASLYGADLRSADLRRAYLGGADLRSANLSSANLSGANLYGADLRSAYLSRANLSSAYLSGANLYGADLRSADLSGANLGETKSDLFEILGESKPELAGLYDALMRGKIDGSAYKGECACLMGTIANCRKVDVDTLTKNSNRPAECWFLGIRKGDTPQSNQISEITRQWIEEFANINDIKLPKFKLISSDEFPGAFL